MPTATTEVNQEADDRSLFAKGFAWASRITTVSIEMVAPGLLGYWLDTQLGTKLVFCLLGFALGVPLAIWHLIRMTAPKTGNDNR